MGKKKSSNAGKMSSGNKKKIRQAQHEKRLARFAKRKEEGKNYKYKKNPYKEGTEEWRDEEYARRTKNHSSKLPYQITQSILRKIDNKLAEDAKNAKNNSKNKKNEVA